MDKQVFLNTIKNVDQLGQLPVTHLQKLVSNYPYFQLGHALLAKRTAIAKLSSYRNLLGKAATYSGDSGYLYQFIEGWVPIKKAVVSKIATDLKEVNVDAIVGNVPENVDFLKERTPSGAIDLRTDTEIIRYEDRLKGMLQQDTPTEEIRVDRRRLAEKAREQLRKEMELANLKETAEERVEEEQASLKEEHQEEKDVSQEVANDLENMVRKRKRQYFGKTKTNDKSKSPITDDFLGSDELREGDENLLKNLSKKIDVHKRKSLFEKWLSGDDEVRLDTAEIEKRKTVLGNQEKDIKNFMEGNKDAINKKRSTEQREDMSVRDNDEILSETMAKVFARQAQYGKAKEIYQKLSLKYPEKSAYFAAKISELKNKR